MKIIDGVERAAQNPNTFQIPTAKQVRRLRPGDIVKLIFSADAETGYVEERLWVQITSRRGRRIVGVIDSQPMVTPDAARGDRVHFDARNIIDVWDESKREALGAGGQRLVSSTANVLMRNWLSN